MIDPATILAQLRELPHETEWVEFKAARSDFDFRDLCKYVSALANEANLHQEPGAGWFSGSRIRPTPSSAPATAPIQRSWMRSSTRSRAN